MLKKPSKLNIVSVIFLVLLPPSAIYLTMEFIGRKSYYPAAVIIIICAILPFFVFFEKRKIQTGEIVILAIMIALAVASRSVLVFLPQVKPTCAIVILTAVAFGPNAGFLTGALSMFLSNFFLGQGMFTPFQMLGMGLTGFIAGTIFYNRHKLSKRWLLSITGGILCFAVYGIIVDTCSVLMLSSSPTLSGALPFYLSGLPFNTVHALTTAMLLFFTAKPMHDKFFRLRIKYGIFETEENYI